MSEVRIIPHGNVAGVWIGNEKGIAGIVARDGQAVGLEFCSAGSTIEQAIRGPTTVHPHPHLGHPRPADGYQPTLDQAAAAALLVLERGEATQPVTRDEFARAANAIRGALWRRRWTHPFPCP
jgi:hypothetical protein